MIEVKPWTYNSVNGNGRIYFDKNERYIDIPESDLISMMNWIKMDRGEYSPFTREEHIKFKESLLSDDEDYIESFENKI